MKSQATSLAAKKNESFEVQDTDSKSGQSTKTIITSRIESDESNEVKKMQRNNYSQEFKDEVAQFAIGSGLNLREVADAYGVSVTLVRNWRQSLLDNARVEKGSSTSPTASGKMDNIDYASLARETIGRVKWATRKEDEIYGGEVFADCLLTALDEAGVDTETRLGFPVWYGAPEEVVMAIVLAFVNDEGMKDVSDPAISRIQNDLYNALQDNRQLEESNPEFWKKAIAVL